MRLRLWIIAGLAAVAGYLTYPARVFDLLVAAQRRLASLTHKTVDVGDLTWHYLEGGNPQGEPLVLLHGFGANKDNWCLYARRFRDNYRIICPDLVGFGDSERPMELAYDTVSQTNRLHGFLVALGIENAHVGGNSMGGMITLQLALLYPQMPLSLALLDSAGTSSIDTNDFQREVETGKNPLAIREPADIDRLVALATYRAPRIPGRLKTVFYEDAKQREAFLDMVFASIADEAVDGGLDDQVAAISQPTLIMWGRQDRILDVSCTELLHARIPRNRLEILEETGHAPMMERPRASSQLHATFLDDVARGAI